MTALGTVLMKCFLPVLAAGLLAVFSQGAMADPALVVGDNHMRLGPGLGYPILLTIADGSTVNTRRCRGTWCEVRVGGRRGFVNVRRLDFAAYAPPRKTERADSRRSASRKSSRSERTSSVSRGARELAPRRNAAPSQPPVEENAGCGNAARAVATAAGDRSAADCAVNCAEATANDAVAVAREAAIQAAGRCAGDFALAGASTTPPRACDEAAPVATP